MREKITGADAFMLDLSVPGKPNRPCLSPPSPALAAAVTPKNRSPDQCAPVIFLAVPDSKANTLPVRSARLVRVRSRPGP